MPRSINERDVLDVEIWRLGSHVQLHEHEIRLISSCELIESQNHSAPFRCKNDQLSSHKYKTHKFVLPAERLH